MTSRKQIAANRRNACKSTGPRTARGKAVARLNSLKHGLSARLIVLPHEDQRLYEAQREELYDRLGPDGALECELVDRLAQLLWRLARAPLAETAMFADAVDRAEMVDTWSDPSRQPPHPEAEPGPWPEAAKAGAKGAGGVSKEGLPQDEDGGRVEAEAGAGDEVAALRNALHFSAGLHDSHGLATERLMRYEAHLERSFQRTLELFLRLQGMRHAEVRANFSLKAEALEGRRYIIDDMRATGVPEEELAPHEARLAAQERAAAKAKEGE